MPEITLTCWSCGKKVHGETSHLPQFSIELIGMAEQAGMVGYLDFNRSRALIFCDEACADKQRTKSGAFRLRPIKVEGRF